MEIRTEERIDHQEWRQLVDEDAATSFFQTPEWSHLLASALPSFAPAHLTARVDGRLVALLPCLTRTRAAVTSLESMPYGTYGGPLVCDQAPPDAARRLSVAFSAETSSVRVGSAQLVDLTGRIDGLDLPGFSEIEYSVQIVELNADYEKLESRFKPSARNKIKKAKKAGVSVRRARSRDDFVSYHAVLEECGSLWAVRPRLERRFFERLSELSGDVVQMWLAVHDGDVVGGDLNFVTNGRVMNWGNVSTARGKELASSNLLHASAIEAAAEEGHLVYDLGASAGIAGIEAFKSSFGARKVPIRRFVRQKPWYRALKRVAGR